MLVYTKILRISPQSLRFAEGGGWISLGIILTFYPIPVRWFAIEDISIEFVYALLGMFLSDFIIKNKEILFQWYAGAVAGIVAFILYAHGFGTVGYKLTGVLMIYLMLTLAVVLSKHEMRVIKYIGTHAFTIYIYSWPIQAVTEFVVVVILKLQWYVTYPCMFLVVLLGPLIIYEIYMKYLPKNKFLDRMIGVKQ